MTKIVFAPLLVILERPIPGYILTPCLLPDGFWNLKIVPDKRPRVFISPQERPIEVEPYKTKSQTNQAPRGNSCEGHRIFLDAKIGLPAHADVTKNVIEYTDRHR